MASSRISLRVRLLTYFLTIASIGVVEMGIGFIFLSSTGRVAVR